MRKIFKQIIYIVTFICYCVTALVVVGYIKNTEEINRIFQVGTYIKTQYLHDATTEQLFEGAARGMVDSLDDPYSVFLDEKEYNDLQTYIEASFGGIGIYLEISKNNELIVSAPIEGTPAYRAGIKPGDIIIKIDNTFASELSYDDAISLMRGKPGSQVKVGVLRGNETELREFALIREIIDVPTVEHNIMDNHIGYLRIKLFATNTDESVWQHLRQMHKGGIKALIIDLRDNPGGDLDAAVNIANYFIAEGPLVYIVDRSGKTKAYASADTNALEIPLVVLVNGGSASASEVLSGALRDYEAAILIGEKTFGKGIVQGVFNLENGEGIKLTTSKYLTPNKIDIHGRGIEPHIAVFPSNEDTIDIQLKTAYEYLKAALDMDVMNEADSNKAESDFTVGAELTNPGAPDPEVFDSNENGPENW